MTQQQPLLLDVLLEAAFLAEGLAAMAGLEAGTTVAVLGVGATMADREAGAVLTSTDFSIITELLKHRPATKSSAGVFARKCATLSFTRWYLLPFIEPLMSILKTTAKEVRETRITGWLR